MKMFLKKESCINMEYNKDINSLLLIREYMLAMDKKLIINSDEELIDLFLAIDEENKTPAELRKYIKIDLGQFQGEFAFQFFILYHFRRGYKGFCQSYLIIYNVVN